MGSGIYLHESYCPFAFFFFFLQVTNFFSFFCWFLMQRDNEDEELCSVFVPTNHLYIGDILLVNSNEIIRPNLSIREGIGMSFVYVAISTLLCKSQYMNVEHFSITFEHIFLSVFTYIFG